MSDLATVLDAAVVKVGARYNDLEKKTSESGIIDLFMKDTNLIVPAAQIERLKTALTRDVDIAVVNADVFDIVDQRAINHTRDEVSTRRVPTNWFTKGFNFTYTPSTIYNNYIEMEEHVAQGFWNGWNSVYFEHEDSIESVLYAFLEANKWSALPGVDIPGINVGGGAYVVPEKDYIVKLPALMRTLKMRGPYYDVANVGSWARQRADSMYGVANERNQAKFLNDMMYFYSNNIDVTDDMAETHFVSQAASLGFLNIYEYDAARRLVGNDGEYYPIVDPWFGNTWGVRITKTAQNKSATHGEGFERALTYTIDVAADFSPIMVSTSRPDESPIIKVDVPIL